jgi:hypothetical protein
MHVYLGRGLASMKGLPLLLKFFPPVVHLYIICIIGDVKRKK